jgi:histidine triad (HIT) family protein
MSDDCLFCRMVEGEIPILQVGETERTLAFLDANPLAPGHTLVIPKSHAARVEGLSSGEARALFEAIHDLLDPVQEAVDADATNIGFNNGEASGQEIPHVHGHIVPRFEGDGGGPIHSVAGSRPSLSDEEKEDVADRIRKAR